MATFLLEVPHEAEMMACVKAVRAFLTTGSHFLSNADWGCKDGEHTAWITIEADSKEEARLAIPPAFRADAKIVQLNKFSLAEIDELARLYHTGPAQEA
jgi:nicotinate-nucleotide pyrophosphorylase